MVNRDLSIVNPYIRSNRFQLLVAEIWGLFLVCHLSHQNSSCRAYPANVDLEQVCWEGERWSAGALLRAVTHQHRVADGQGNVVAQDLGPSAGFATFGLNAAYRFSSQLQLSAGVDNLFDRAYSEHLNLAGSADFGFPADPVRINEPGRSLWMKVNYRY